MRVKFIPYFTLQTLHTSIRDVCIVNEVHCALFGNLMVQLILLNKVARYAMHIGRVSILRYSVM